MQLFIKSPKIVLGVFRQR